MIPQSAERDEVPAVGVVGRPVAHLGHQLAHLRRRGIRRLFHEGHLLVRLRTPTHGLSFLSVATSALVAPSKGDGSLPGLGGGMHRKQSDLLKIALQRLPRLKSALWYP